MTKHPRIYPGLADSFVLVLVIGVMGVVAAPLYFLRKVVDAEIATLVYYLAAFGGSFLVLNTARRRINGASPYHLWPGSWLTLLLLALGAQAVLNGVAGPLGSLLPTSESFRRVAAEMGGQVGVAAFLTFVVAAPILEELIFRGILLDGLLQRYRPVPAILWTSFLFGVTHLNAPQFVTGLSLGVFLGWVYWRTRRVGACIVIHMAANLGGYCLRFLIDVEVELAADRGVIESYGGLGRFVMVEVLCLAVLAGVIWGLRRSLERDGAEAPAPDRWLAPGPETPGDEQAPGPTLHAGG